MEDMLQDIKYLLYKQVEMRERMKINYKDPMKTEILKKRKVSTINHLCRLYIESFII